MSTLLLNPATWDLVIDVDGNIAVASEPYSYSQDVSSACELFSGELYYDTTQGVENFSILGNFPPTQFIKNSYVTAALTVPGIVAAVCFILGISEERVLSGQVQSTDKNGNLIVTGF